MECSQKLRQNDDNNNDDDDDNDDHAIQHALTTRMMSFIIHCRCFSTPNGTRITSINWELPHQLPLQTGVFSSFTKITSNSTVIAISCGPSSGWGLVRPVALLDGNYSAITRNFGKITKSSVLRRDLLSVIVGMQERLHEILTLLSGA
jgi:hypothetical protein